MYNSPCMISKITIWTIKTIIIILASFLIFLSAFSWKEYFSLKLLGTAVPAYQICIQNLPDKIIPSGTKEDKTNCLNSYVYEPKNFWAKTSLIFTVLTIGLPVISAILFGFFKYRSTSLKLSSI